MAQGSLKLPVADVRNRPVTGTVNVEFEPVKLAGNAGGVSMQTGEFDPSGDTELTITGIECLGGPGTLYRVGIRAANYKTYASFQRIVEQHVNRSADNRIRLAVNPGRVKDVATPDYSGLPLPLQHFLNQAKPIPHEPEDRDIAELTGPDLYGALGPLRKACLLNLFTKANHGTTDRVFRFLYGHAILLLRQDRLFATIDPAVEEFLSGSERYKSAPNQLHRPLPGYQIHHSFKSRDDHANIQVTLMRKPTTGEMAADIDLDESSGIEHGFETLSNVFRGRTNPYLMRELMILSDTEELTLDPGYNFVFR